MDVSNSLWRDELQARLQVAVHVIGVSDSIPLFQRFDDGAMIMVGTVDGLAGALARLHQPLQQWLHNAIDL